MGKQGCGKYERYADPRIRKQQLLNAAVELALQVGFSNMTRDSIAQFANVSTGLINFHFDSIKQLRKELIKLAIDKEILPIIIQAIGKGEIKLNKLPPEVRTKIADYLSNINY